MRGSFRVVAR